MSSRRDRKPIALVTGASSGIGKATAEILAEQAHDLILVARRVAILESQAAELNARFGITATVIGADLESGDGCHRLVQDVRGRGLAIGILVNYAGFGIFGEFKNTPLAPEIAMMQLNMMSVVALTKAFLPDLIASRGRILNVASTAAFQPGPYMTVYYATKAFVLSFSEALAAELYESAVTVTALCPGPTISGFQQRASMENSALVKGKRLPTAEAVAAAGYRAMQRGQRVCIPGAMNWILAQSPRFVPRNWVTAIVRRMSRPA